MARNLELSVRLRAAVEGLNEVSQLIKEIDDLGGETERASKRSKALNDQLNELGKADKAVDSFVDLRREVNQTRTALDEAQEEAQRLGRELGQAEKPTKKLQQEFERARKSVTALKDAEQKQTQQLQKQRQELSRLGVSTRDLGSAQREIRRNIDATTKDVDLLTKSLQRARDESAKEFQDPTDRLERGAESATRAMDGLSARIRRTASVAVGSVAAFFGIREAVQGIAGIARVGGEFEILQSRLDALTGSAEAGEEAFAWIREFTKNTPFQMDQVTDAFVRAKAFGLDPMDGTLQAIADQAAKTGGGMEALNGIVTALGQAYSKGKIQAEEMLQLVERGVPAWDLLSQATGRTVGELQKMTTAGQLGRQEIELLINQLGKAGTGAAEAQMTTLNGLISNLKDSFTEFLNLVNDEGLLEYLKTQLRDISDRFREMRESGDLREFAREVSDSIIRVIEAVKSVATTLYEYRTAIVETTKAFLAFKAAQLSINFVKFGRDLTVAALTPMANLGKETAKTTKATGRLSAALRAIPGPVKLAALAAAAVGLDDVFIKAGTAIGEFAAKNSEAARSLDQLQQQMRDRAKDELNAIDQEIERLEQYRTVRQVTAEEAIRLSDQEREAREQQLKGAEALFLQEFRANNRLEQLGHDVTERQKATKEALDRTRASMRNLSEAGDALIEVLRTGVSIAARELVDQFDNLIERGESVQDAVSGIFSDFNTSSVTDVRTLVEAISEIRTKSEEAGRALDAEIAQRLDDMTGEEIRLFALELRAAFQNGTKAVDEFKKAADALADAALNKIGTSLQEIRTGVAEMESDALGAFQAFVDSGTRSADEVAAAVESLKEEIKSPEAVAELRKLLNQWAGGSVEKVEEVKKALNSLATDVKGTAENVSAEIGKAISSAGSQEALDEVRGRVQKLWTDGEITAEQYNAMLVQIRQQQRELSADADDTSDSVGDLGDQADQTGEQLRNMGEAGAQAGEDTRTNMERAASAAAGIGAFYDGLTAKLAAMSRAAVDSFRKMQGATVTTQDSIQGMQDRIESLGASILALGQKAPADFIGITNWMRRTARDAQIVERNFLQQKVAVERLLEAFNRGDYSASVFSRSVDDLSRQFDLLDEQDLGALQNAVKQVQSEVDSLDDSLKDTIASLRQELAGLRGDNEEVERLRYQEQRLELEQQLQRARELGDQEAINAAQEALSLQRQAYNLRQEQNRAESAAEQQRAAEEAAREERDRQRQEAEQREVNTQNAAQQSRQVAYDNSQRQPGTTIVLQAPSGNSAEVTGNQTDLLTVLEELGLRSAAGVSRQ